jgi:ribosomal protein S18 acetylase RimI-like enzyme
MDEFDISYKTSPAVTDDELNVLFADAWEQHENRDFQSALKHSLLFVCAYHGSRLIGFVNVAWDGAQHAFLLDATVHTEFQRRGIGIDLVKHAAEETGKHDIDWLHVDFEPHLEAFYRKCGFRFTNAGLMNLKKVR